MCKACFNFSICINLLWTKTAVSSLEKEERRLMEALIAFPTFHVASLTICYSKSAESGAE